MENKWKMKTDSSPTSKKDRRSWLSGKRNNLFPDPACLGMWGSTRPQVAASSALVTGECHASAARSMASPLRGKRWPSWLLWLTTRSCPYPTPDEVAARSGPPALHSPPSPCRRGRVRPRGRTALRGSVAPGFHFSDGMKKAALAGGIGTSRFA